MKINELIEKLYVIRDLYGNLDIVMQKDSEGNGYSPLAGACDGMYIADTTWRGDFFEKEDYEDQYDEDDEPFKVNSVVLWPVN